LSKLVQIILARARAELPVVRALKEYCELGLPRVPNGLDAGPIRLVNNRFVGDLEATLAQSLGQGNRGRYVCDLMTTAQAQPDIYVFAMIGREGNNAVSIRDALQNRERTGVRRKSNSRGP